MLVRTSRSTNSQSLQFSAFRPNLGSVLASPAGIGFFRFLTESFKRPDATLKILSTITNRDSRNSNIFVPRSMLGHGSNPAHGDAKRIGVATYAPRFSPYHYGVSRTRRGHLILNVYGQLPDIGSTIWPNGDERINGLRR